MKDIIEFNREVTNDYLVATFTLNGVECIKMQKRIGEMTEADQRYWFNSAFDDGMAHLRHEIGK